MEEEWRTAPSEQIGERGVEDCTKCEQIGGRGVEDYTKCEQIGGIGPIDSEALFLPIYCCCTQHISKHAMYCHGTPVHRVVHDRRLYLVAIIDCTQVGLNKRTLYTNIPRIRMDTDERELHKPNS